MEQPKGMNHTETPPFLKGFCLIGPELLELTIVLGTHCDSTPFSLVREDE